MASKATVALVVLLQHATRAADAQATPLSLETYPQLTDNAWLWALAERGSTAPAASGSAVPPVPSDFRCSLLLRSSEGGTNSSIAGPAFVAGSLAKVRMTGLYHVQLSGFENAQAANIILAPDRTTIIMDDPSLPAGAPPRCTLQRPSVLSTQMLAAASPGVDVGFVYVGTVLTRLYFRRLGTITNPGTVTWTFVDGFTSVPVAIIDQYPNGDQTWALYGDVVTGPVVGPVVPPSLVEPPVGIRCRPADASQNTTAQSLVGLYAETALAGVLSAARVSM
jgi:hypothetical protein